MLLWMMCVELNRWCGHAPPVHARTCAQLLLFVAWQVAHLCNLAGRFEVESTLGLDYERALCCRISGREVECFACDAGPGHGQLCL